MPVRNGTLSATGPPARFKGMYLPPVVDVGVKLAETLAFALIVTRQPPVPLQAPPHPAKV
jgi:hypothetical protein